MDLFDDRLLLNILVVVSGPLVFQLFIRDAVRRSQAWTSVFIGFVMTLDQVLCMLFPLKTISDFEVDLRVIPMVLGGLYGGAPVGLFLMGAFAVQRYLMGGAHAVTTAAIYGICMGVILLLNKTYQQLARWNRILFAAIPAITVTACSDAFIYIHLFTTAGIGILLAEYTAVTVVVLWIAVMIIEYTNESFRLREEIHQAEKYHVLGELAASIAHEIRNPMTVARGFLQLTHESQSLDESHAKYIATAISEIDRAHGVINDYLSFAKPRYTQVADTGIEITVQRVVEVLRPYATLHNVSVTYLVKENAVVRADPEHLMQILVNIAKNGVEAMPAGGVLHIQVAREKGFGVIDISDTGIGMTKEQIQRLGHPFYSTKSNGTGLGLMTSYRLCQNMNGRIDVRSTLGKGSHFTIKLPAAT
ncbi:hypothetical protein LLE49_17340 [Alicyclobacillus tolerans]|uniref:ATP-binding protein n=1 Tax=Alicyclobacillus tolerans TaxID=90970 RepID=UPI001F368E84|nr:ATP-binding protein [Alicyclobacillus tolerans]MCF8566490.1 hypothetical protein [Alicyclobacillus tolerans]